MRLPAIIEKELEPLRGRWRIEQGHGHLKIIVDERLAGVISAKKSEAPHKGSLAVRSQIRRIIRK